MKKISVCLPVLIEHEWQAIMARSCLEMARATTGLPYELCVVETVAGDGPGYFADWDHGGAEFRYLRNHARTNVCHNSNQSLDLASGEILVLIGSDVFLKPGWLEATARCFDLPDCGMATLASTDLHHQAIDRIFEGVYTPFMAFLNRHDWRFDEINFPNGWNDTDLVLRIYEAGFRSYRNWSVVISHLGRQTVTLHDQRDGFEDGKRRFIEMHSGTARTLMFRHLVEGLIM